MHQQFLAVILVAFTSGAAASNVTINFDDTPAPDQFLLQVPLAEQYASLGVHFQGTGEVLNFHSNFSYVPLDPPFSSPNFLAFNIDLSIYPPETITFDYPIQNLALDFAGGFGTIYLRGYLGTTLIDSVSAVHDAPWITIALHEGVYDRVVFDVAPGIGNGQFAIDNLTFAPVPIPAAAWLLGSALGVLGWMRRKQAIAIA